MGNKCTANSSNNDSSESFYFNNNKFNLIDTNANYDKLNDIIENLVRPPQPFNIISDNLEKDKLTYAIHNCIIEENTASKFENGNNSCSSHFSLEHGNVANDENIFYNFDDDSFLIDSDKILKRDVPLHDKEIDNDLSMNEKSSLSNIGNRSKRVRKKNKSNLINKNKVISHLSNQNLLSNLALQKIQMKRKNFDDGDTKKFNDIKGGNKVPKEKHFSVISLLNPQVFVNKSLNNQNNKSNINNKSRNEKEKAIFEVSNIENISLIGCNTESMFNKKTSYGMNQIQEQFFSISPAESKELEQKRKEEAHNKNILEHLKEIITLDSNNKFIFNKTNYDKVNEFTILSKNEIDSQKESKIQFNPMKVNSLCISKQNSIRKQQTFSKKFTINYPTSKRQSTNIIQNQIQTKIVQKMKIANFFFKNVKFYSELKKVINITDRIIYANRFCVLTKDEFKCYKSKEEFVVVQNPLLTIPLYSIKNVNIISMNRKGVVKNKNTHFGIKYNKTSQNESESVESSLNIDMINGEDQQVDVEFFGSEESDLIKKWIHEIKNWMDKE